MRKTVNDERRRHRRFPIVEGLVEPIEVAWTEDEAGEGRKMPAVLTDLSAGGMSILTFIEPPHTRRIYLQINLPGLDNVAVEARVLRVHTKGQIFTLGLEFVKIHKRHQEKITHMAEDYNDCETRIALKLPEACVPNCRCHAFCSKPQKSAHWPPRA